MSRKSRTSRHIDAAHALGIPPNGTASQSLFRITWDASALEDLRAIDWESLADRFKQSPEYFYTIKQHYHAPPNSNPRPMPSAHHLRMIDQVKAVAEGKRVVIDRRRGF